MKLIMDNWRNLIKEDKKIVQERAYTPIGRGIVPGKNMVYFLLVKDGQLFYGTAEAEDPEEMQLAFQEARLAALNSQPIDGIEKITHQIPQAIKARAEKIMSSK